jgi:hypothetical protein
LDRRHAAFFQQHLEEFAANVPLQFIGWIRLLRLNESALPKEKQYDGKRVDGAKASGKLKSTRRLSRSR